ncbi:hypothetical protein T265_02530 [Opisthorchis viverrini]|uniref:Uncharacterized protein n=1 Tax=Opisthorchis viverrini TaxID=6198 RepID=A0A074ZUV0_OPIVI|nr:hypothetical protein T265_02530 [Opisthorchis viverrini]KER31213.1 hypothetical protein T265_02530 [Opisthorchis viverrini]
MSTNRASWVYGLGLPDLRIEMQLGPEPSLAEMQMKNRPSVHQNAAFVRSLNHHAEASSS